MLLQLNSYVLTLNNNNNNNFIYLLGRNKRKTTFVNRLNIEGFGVSQNNYKASTRKPKYIELVENIRSETLTTGNSTTQNTSIWLTDTDYSSTRKKITYMNKKKMEKEKCTLTTFEQRKNYNYFYSITILYCTI